MGPSGSDEKLIFALGGSLPRNAVQLASRFGGERLLSLGNRHSRFLKDPINRGFFALCVRIDNSQLTNLMPD